MRKIRERIREIYRKHTPSVKLPLIILTVLFCMIPLLVESRILARSSRQEQVERRIIDVQNQCQILSNKMSRSGYLTNSARIMRPSTQNYRSCRISSAGGS